jgi:hypothetical protein
MKLRACVFVAVIAVLGFKLRRGESPKSAEPATLEAPAKSDRVVAAPWRALEFVRDDGDEAELDGEPGHVESDEAEESSDDEAPAVVVEKPLPSAGGNTIHGRIHDSQSGEPLAGVTVVVTSPALAQTQTAITDDDGYYKIVELPAGDYLVTLYYLDHTVEHPNVRVSAIRSAVVDDDMDTFYQARPLVFTITEDE